MALAANKQLCNSSTRVQNNTRAFTRGSAACQRRAVAAAPLQSPLQSRDGSVLIARAAPPVAVDAGRFIPRWSQCFSYLRKERLETVSPEAAARLVESGEYVLVDVRKEDAFQKGAPAPAVGIPLYQTLNAMAGGFDATKVRVVVGMQRGEGWGRGSGGFGGWWGGRVPGGVGAVLLPCSRNSVSWTNAHKSLTTTPSITLHTHTRS